MHNYANNFNLFDVFYRFSERSRALFGQYNICNSINY